ncbi:hypothetical protein QCA50_014841 [Cerrena zonata]|uniref:MYND-type domain-containing protein n=1 Tax=Cerrena zonata TaxID=2478898 RepID=A0AAW0FVF3_9APHY
MAELKLWPRLTVDKLETKEARHSLVECKVMTCRYHHGDYFFFQLVTALGGKMKGNGVKLFACSGCKTTLYCSKACQKEDWPRHKRECQCSQRTRAKADKDSLPLRDQSHTTSPSNRVLQPSDILDELNEFRKHFLPTLTLVMMNAFCDVETSFPRLWETHLFLCQLERIPNLPPSTPPWARFRLLGAGPYLIDHLFPQDQIQNHTDWRTTRQENVARNLGIGFGTLSLCVACAYQDKSLNTYSDMQFSLVFPIELAVERVKNWKEILEKNICGDRGTWKAA